MGVGGLIEDLDLREKQQFPISQSKRYIVRNGMPLMLPLNPVTLIMSNFLSIQAKSKILLEPLLSWNFGRSNSKVNGEKLQESVGEFFRRHFGPEVVDYLVDPFVAGTSGGDPESLSMRHAFPELWNIEQKHGSVIMGAILSRLNRKGTTRKSTSARKKHQRGSFSFHGGMQVLTDRLCDEIGGANLKLMSKVLSLSCGFGEERQDSSWAISYAGSDGNTKELKKCDSFDAVIMTAPLCEVQNLEFTKGGKPFVLDFLPKINYLPMSVLITSFKKDTVKKPLEGFGVLVPSKEQQNGLKTLGTLFSSMMFPDRAPTDEYLYTTFIGGSRNPNLAGASLDELKQVVLSDLKKLLGVEGQPRFLKHIYWRKAFPLYDRDYDRVLEAIEKMERSLPGFFYAGNHRDGLSVGKAITSGLTAADHAISYINSCKQEK